jgi:hypothetical protein
MIAMNSKLFVLLSCAFLCATVPVHAKTVLPDACGDDSVKFDVKTAEGQPRPAPPPEGKAQIVFFENAERYGFYLTEPSTRFGIDGAWVGANKGNSYFVSTVDPGLHHLCVNWQSGKDSESSKVSMASVTAEPNKTYYFQVKILLRQDSQGWVKERTFELTQLGEDDGKYRMKASALSTSKPAK